MQSVHPSAEDRLVECCLLLVHVKIPLFTIVRWPETDGPSSHDASLQACILPASSSLACSSGFSPACIVDAPLQRGEGEVALALRRLRCLLRDLVLARALLRERGEARAPVADDDRPAGAAAGAADGPPPAPKNVLMPPVSELRLRWSGFAAALPVEAVAPGMSLRLSPGSSRRPTGRVSVSVAGALFSLEEDLRQPEIRSRGPDRPKMLRRRGA